MEFESLGILHAVGLVESTLQMHRRTATKVHNGRVQRKNRWTRPENNCGAHGVAIERARPGAGYIHAVSQDELYSFLHNLDDWPDLANGLDKIVLAEGWNGYYGYYCSGTIGLRAFDSSLTVSYALEQKLRDRDFFESVSHDIECPDESDDSQSTESRVIYHLTRGAARAFMLVHVLSHELGHHLDRMSNQRRDCPHGEPYAYRYEWAHAPRFWQTYLHVFGDPRKERE